MLLQCFELNFISFSTQISFRQSTAKSEALFPSPLQVLHLYKQTYGFWGRRRNSSIDVSLYNSPVTYTNIQKCYLWGLFVKIYFLNLTIYWASYFTLFYKFKWVANLILWLYELYPCVIAAGEPAAVGRVKGADDEAHVAERAEIHQGVAQLVFFYILYIFYRRLRTPWIFN